MDKITLEVNNRDTSLGRGALNKMRGAGELPGVVYGAKVGTVPISVSKKQLNDILARHGANAIITLNINGQAVQAMVKEIQTHPVTGRYWHVDFNEIAMDRKIKAEVQVHFEGEPQGVKDGGILQYGDPTVEVECLPGDLPDRFVLDVSSLKIGDKYTVQDLTEIENVKILTEPEKVLVSVIPPVMDTEDSEEPEEAPEQAEEAEAGTEE
ncbi:MAG: 50S ribosomal protein L25 [Peptococcales bacterium]